MDLSNLSFEQVNNLYKQSECELRKRFQDNNVDSSGSDSDSEEGYTHNKENDAIMPGIQPLNQSSVFIDSKASKEAKKRGPKPGHDRQKPISKAQQYWDKFGPELYDDATRELGKLTAQQLMSKYACNTEEGKITKYMVGELIKIGKRQEGIAV